MSSSVGSDFRVEQNVLVHSSGEQEVSYDLSQPAERVQALAVLNAAGLTLDDQGAVVHADTMESVDGVTVAAASLPPPPIPGVTEVDPEALDASLALLREIAVAVAAVQQGGGDPEAVVAALADIGAVPPGGNGPTAGDRVDAASQLRTVSTERAGEMARKMAQQWNQEQTDWLANLVNRALALLGETAEKDREDDEYRKRVLRSGEFGKVLKGLETIESLIDRRRGGTPETSTPDSSNKRRH